MPRQPNTKPKEKKSGAQPGNKNAQKHGFYSKQFTTDETKRLKSADLFSIESEIELINVFMDRLSKLVKLKELKEDELKAVNTLSLMMQSKSTMIRTHYLTRGKGGSIETTMLEALEEIRIEMGL
jgi:uncharacterized protein YjcR